MNAQFAMHVTEMLCFAAKENVFFTVEWEHNLPHVMLWAGMTATCLIGL
jgi:hypothetical protein